MHHIKWRMLLPYAGLPVLAAVLLASQLGRVEPVALLLRGLLLVFGYVAAVLDAREKKIPNRLIGGLLLAWICVIVPQLFLRTELALSLILTGGLGAVVAGLIFLTVYLVSRKGLGGGDVKLMTVCGLYLGLGGVMSAMLCGCVLAALAGGGMILLKKLGPKDTIPLVPFLYVGIALNILIQ